MIIPYQKYRFRIAVSDYMNLPQYKGSTFRGAFGNIFRRIACTLRRKECRDCLLNSTCIYAFVFETMPPGETMIMGMDKYEKVPHPFIIEPPGETKHEYKDGEEITFGLVLVGRAIDYLPYFILTFEGLGRIGLGRGRGKYVLREVDAGGYVVYSDEDKTIRRINPERVEIPETLGLADFEKPDTDEAIEINLVTPLRMMYERKLVTVPEFHILIRNLLRRLNLLHYFHCEMRVPSWDHNLIIREASGVKIAENGLRWHDWERYSSRQQTKMKMGGLVGRIRFNGCLSPFIPIIRAGEVLHAGKGTSFGLGRYSIADGSEVLH